MCTKSDILSCFNLMKLFLTLDEKKTSHQVKETMFVLRLGMQEVHKIAILNIDIIHEAF